MRLFWQHGYEATTVADLTATMGITPPSLYTAFGDKKRLFLEAVDRYMGGPVTAQTIIDEAATAQDAASTLLQGAATAFTDPGNPPGCLLASAAISCSPQAQDVQRALAARRGAIGRHLAEKIAQDIAKGRLPADVHANTMAAHVMAVIQGLSTLARDGATRQALIAVATHAMTTWKTQDEPA